MRALGRVMVLFSAVLLTVAGGCAQRGDAEDAEVAVADAAPNEPSDEETPDGEPSDEPSEDVDADEGQAAETDDPPAAELAELDDGETRCVAERLDDAGLHLGTLLTDAVSVEDRIALVEVFIDCVPRHDVLADLTLGEVFRIVAGSADISAPEAVCTLEYILEKSDQPARVLVAPTEADMEIFIGGLATCLTEEHFDIATGVPGTGPQVYGDDARLDSLVDDCEGGDPRACDLLFLSSNQGSDYEEVALTCGGTRESDPEEFCSREAETDDSGFAPADSPGLQALAEDCKDGDATACDLLYVLAPLGHELENVGFTCGGELLFGAMGDCRTELG